MIITATLIKQQMAKLFSESLKVLISEEGI